MNTILRASLFLFIVFILLTGEIAHYHYAQTITKSDIIESEVPEAIVVSELPKYFFSTDHLRFNDVINIDCKPLGSCAMWDEAMKESVCFGNPGEECMVIISFKGGGRSMYKQACREQVEPLIRYNPMTDRYVVVYNKHVPIR